MKFIDKEGKRVLLELGFDPLCIGFYQYNVMNRRDEIHEVGAPSRGNNTAPLLEQALTWFREEHKLNSFIRYVANHKMVFQIEGIGESGLGIGYNFTSTKYPEYDIVDDARLEKLIEIVTNRVNNK